MSEEQKNSKRSLFAVFLVVFLDMTGFGLLLPSLPFLNQELGGTAATLGWIIASFSVGQMIAAPAFGRWSDRIGRKPVLIATVSLSVVGNLAYAVSPNTWALLASRFVAGMAAGNLSVARAYVADVTPVERRSAAMGLIGAAFGLGFTVGPGLGAAAGSLGLRAPGYFAALFNLLNLVLLVRNLQEPPHASKSSSVRGRYRPDHVFAVVSAIVMYVLAIAGFAGFETIGALMTQASFGWGNQENGILFAGAGLLAVLIQGGIIRRISGKIDDRIILAFGYILMIAGFAILAVDTMGLPRFLGGAVLVGSGISFAQPAVFALFSSLNSDTKQGAAMGWLHAGGSLARIIGPTWAGYAFGTGGNPLVYGVSSVALTAAVLLLFGAWRSWGVARSAYSLVPAADGAQE